MLQLKKKKKVKKPEQPKNKGLFSPAEKIGLKVLGKIDLSKLSLEKKHKNPNA